jgi:hypothetical protein
MIIGKPNDFLRNKSINRKGRKPACRQAGKAQSSQSYYLRKSA